MLQVAIAGVAGRMGCTLVRYLGAQERVRITAGSVRAGSARVGEDIGAIAGIAALDIAACDDVEALFSEAQAVIDFTTPDYTRVLATQAARTKTPLVCATTGMTPEDHAHLAECATQVPVVWAANMSVGINVMLWLAEQAAAMLDDAYDVEIVEVHHRQKRDAPSGTALALGKAAARGRGVEFSEVACLSREGMMPERPRGEIGFATMRGGQVVGDHQMILAGAQDRLEIVHRSDSRDIYAEGALRAARWLQTQPAGLYGMAEVLGR